MSRHLVACRPLFFYWVISWQCFSKTKCKLAMGSPMMLWIALNGEEACKLWPLKVKGVKNLIKIGYVHIFLVGHTTSLLWVHPCFCIIIHYLTPSLGWTFSQSKHSSPSNVHKITIVIQMHSIQLIGHQKSQERSTLNLSSLNPNSSNVVVQ